MAQLTDGYLQGYWRLVEWRRRKHPEEGIPRLWAGMWLSALHTLNIAVVHVLVSMTTRWTTGGFPRWLTDSARPVWIVIGMAMFAWTGLLAFGRLPSERTRYETEARSVVDESGTWVRPYTVGTFVSFLSVWLLGIADTIVRRQS